MQAESIEIHKYIDEKKELQAIILQIIESPSDNTEDIQKLLTFLNIHKYENNKQELGHFLHLISSISINHHRGPDFFKKIEEILTSSSKFYQSVFSNQELYFIFHKSNPIILSLLKAKIIEIDEIILNFLKSINEKFGDRIIYYFYPEIKSFDTDPTSDISTESIDGIENFELNRQKGENESRISTIIRDDLIDDFIKYIHRTNISLKSEINQSFFETNSMLIEKDPTLIEYAAFFGSIQIIKYLEINQVELTPSIWLYAVHSNNPEVIQFLEDKQIEMDDRTFSEAIKCHHNEIVRYIIENKFDTSTNITDLDDETVLSIFESNNYEFFPYEIDGNNVFFGLRNFEFTELINLYLKIQKSDIENYINQRKKIDTNELIITAINEKRLDIAYYLLMELNRIPDNYFYGADITKIVLPSTIRSIGFRSFGHCKSLKWISLSSSLKKISEESFFNCKSLKKITIPSSVIKIESKAFNFCSSLSQIIFTIPSSVTSIGHEAFEYCSSLHQIIIPPNVTSEFSSLFSRCSSLTKVIILAPITTIKSFNFKRCSSLKEITIPSTIHTIESFAFSDCKQIKKIVIFSCDKKHIKYLDGKFLVIKPKSKKDKLAWVDPTINTVIIPSYIKTIGGAAFNGCELLKQVNIPSSVTCIESNAFSGCSSMTEITFEMPSSLNRIAENAFYGCTSLEEITIPSSVTYMGQNVFEKCRSLKKVTIPSSIIQRKLGITSDVEIIRI